MKCWVCKRQARGWAHSDPRYPVTDPRHHIADWVFCSARCLEIFHAMYGNWRHLREGLAPLKEISMIDPSQAESQAMHQCLRHFGQAAEEIGFEKPLGAYSEAEALRVIDAIVSGYTQAMAEHHEATRYPPVRGMPDTPDPFEQALSATPFEDMPSDTPWQDSAATATTASTASVSKKGRRS